MSEALPDWDRSTELLGGWHAVIAVSPSGDVWPWLLAPGGDDEHHGCRCPKCAPHEQPGRLPDMVRKRLWGMCWRIGCERPAGWRGAWCDEHRHTACEGTTVAGRPCRNVVYDGWRQCRKHRGKRR